MKVEIFVSTSAKRVKVNLKQEVKDAKAKLTQIERNVKVAKSVADLEKKLAGLSGLNDKIRAAKKTADKAGKAKLSNKLASNKERIKKIKVRIKALRAKIVGKIKAVKPLETQLKAAKKEHAKLAARLEKSKALNDKIKAGSKKAVERHAKAKADKKPSRRMKKDAAPVEVAEPAQEPEVPARLNEHEIKNAATTFGKAVHVPHGISKASAYGVMRRSIMAKLEPDPEEIKEVFAENGHDGTKLFIALRDKFGLMKSPDSTTKNFIGYFADVAGLYN